MPSIRQSIRSSTASKRPTSAIADGQIALNTASGTPGIFFKDSAGNIVKAGPAHYGATAPNSSPAVGGSTGNSIGEAWLDSSLTPAGWKIWNGSAWVNATPLSSDTVQGLVELATNAEVQAGVDTARAVTAAGLQSKVSDSISTTSSSGIASSSAVKTAYDLANAALPKSGGIITGNLEIGSTGSFTFEGATADGFETTLAVVDPTADRTITFPNITGTVVTTGDTGTVTGTMIADGTIVNAEISPTAAIAFSKLASLTSANIIVGNASGVPSGVAMTGDVTITNAGVTAISSNVIVNADVNSSAAIAYSKLALSSGITNTDVSASAAIVYSKLALSNSIVNADINSAAAIAGTKISPDFGSQNLTTTGNITTTNHIAASGTATTPSIQVGNGTTYKPGIYSPGVDQLAISTNGTERLRLTSAGLLGIGTSAPGARLSVISADNLAATTIADFGASNGTSAIQLGYNRITQVNSTPASAFLQLGVSNKTDAIHIDGTGNVGIGTTSPQSSLDVASAPYQSVRTYLSSITDTYHQYRGTPDGTGFEHARVFSGRDTSVHTYGSYLAFYTEGKGSGTTDTSVERLRIDSSGRVGIGTIAPGQLLQIEGASNPAALIKNTTSNVQAYFYATSSAGVFGTPTLHPLVFNVENLEKARIDTSGRLLVGTSTYDGNARAVIQGNTTSNTTGALVVRYNGTRPASAGEGIGSIRFESTSQTSSNYHYASISCDTDGASTSDTDIPGRLVFSTTADGAASPTERMRIRSTGWIDSFSSASDTFVVRSSSAAGTTNFLFRGTNVATGTADGTVAIQVFTNGNVQNTNNSYGAISDLKLKENIVDANSQWDDLKALQVRNYNSKEGQTHTQIGLVAQEVELVSPGLVFESPDRDEEGNDLGTVTKGVNYSVLYMKAVKALQEAMERIEALETDVAALKGA